MSGDAANSSGAPVALEFEIDGNVGELTVDAAGGTVRGATMEVLYQLSYAAAVGGVTSLRAAKRPSTAARVVAPRRRRSESLRSAHRATDGLPHVRGPGRPSTR